MNGFITESVGKISDGIANAIKLVIFYAITTLLLIPVEHYFQRPGILIYIFLLLAIAGFELHRTLIARTSEPRRAWHGLAAGLFFWQVVRYTADLSNLALFQQAAMIYWVMVVLITVVLWKKLLPIGVRSAMLVLLVCWLGKLYQMGFTYLLDWPPFINFGYGVLRYLVGLGGVIALFLIIFRSRDLNSRIYSAVTIFAGVLFMMMAF
jgi:hypothetical protein